MARKALQLEVPPATNSPRCIALEGIRVHNLRGFDLRIRHNALTVICGVSGSGKSSLAFDTLYAEGQRRYIETFSPSARQFLDRIERPDVDRITGLPPAIAIRQQQRSEGARTTLGTKTEIVDYLRVLFARLGSTVCPECGTAVRPISPEAATAEILSNFQGRLLILARVVSSGADTAQTLQEFVQAGFTRLVHDGRMIRLEEADPSKLIGEFFIVVDRLKSDPDSKTRIAEAMTTAMSRSDGRCDILAEQPTASRSSAAMKSMVVDGASWHAQTFSSRRVCTTCQRQFPEPTPEHLSFNSPLGACRLCEGTGFIRDINDDTRASSARRRTETKRNNAARRSVVCTACHGSRLNSEAMSQHWGHRTIFDAAQLECAELMTWLEATYSAEPDALQAALKPAFDQATRRLQMLIDLGLGYLSLHRPLATLSGGESQRAALTSALASGLINTLFVLDEPTAGLHPGDTARVLDKIRSLQRRGNTVVVVEHDPTMILAADDVIEIGPGAGNDGGQLVFQGTPDLLSSSSTVTAKKLSEQRTSRIEPPVTSGRRKSKKSEPSLDSEASSVRRPEQWLELRGVHCHNLVNLDVRLPLGVFCAVVGVSGSGKSSLIAESVYPEVCRRLSIPFSALSTGRIEDVGGIEKIENVLLLDQSPIPRTRRSIPATWIGIFDDIRILLAETHEGKKRNYSRAMFSFNAANGGRCPVCEGRGIVTVAMQFLADIETTCEECHGQRFRPEVLEVRYRDRSIYDILNMTADDAFLFFNGHHRIQQRLNAMRQAGLGYIRLGQPLSTVSGGEAQRLRIAALLAGLPLSDGEVAAENRKTPTLTRSGRTLFLLDEPSVGLHLQDLDHLLNCIRFLTQTGHSVIAIDHDPALTSQADWMIELGPGPGQLGGQLVYEGPPRSN